LTSAVEDNSILGKRYLPQTETFMIFQGFATVYMYYNLALLGYRVLVTLSTAAKAGSISYPSTV
jgi:hypothetical protein